MFERVPRTSKHHASDVRVPGEAELESHRQVNVLEAREVGRARRA